MPRAAAAISLDAVIHGAIRDTLARAAGSIASAIANLAAAELEKQLSVMTNGHGRKRVARVARARPRGEEITRWVADNRARRVPTFVIEMTGGLDTKKKIVAKYGANAAFEKGKPLPKPS